MSQPIFLHDSSSNLFEISDADAFASFILKKLGPACTPPSLDETRGLTNDFTQVQHHLLHTCSPLMDTFYRPDGDGRLPFFGFIDLVVPIGDLWGTF